MMSKGLAWRPVVSQSAWGALIVWAGLVVANTVEAGDAAAGKVKAALCTECHGRRGEGNAANPRLAGMPEHTLVKTLKAFRHGQGDSAAMHVMARELNDQDIANLATYYSSLK
jgi:cytochrome c553